MLHPKRTLNCGGKLLSLDTPQVMGILNLTPDSFFAESRHRTRDEVLRRAGRMLEEGAAILDLGGMSSRPGADLIPEEEELQRVLPALEAVVQAFPEAIVSIDTVRSGVARRAVEAGAAIINDISAGRFDEEMYATAADLQVPYVLMHMQGTPRTMQEAPAYEDVVREVLDFFISETGRLRALGVKDMILDPGFGFGKTRAHNFRLLNHLHVFQLMDLPVLTGISRKGMICRTLNIDPEQALNGTSALHMVALQQGSRLLRVHDVKEAVEVVRLWGELEKEMTPE